MNRQTARKQWADVFSALGSEPRLRILELLASGDVPCQDILRHVGLSQPATSYHLAKLERAGILLKKRTGTRNCYQLREGTRQLLQSVLQEDGSWNTP
jgi:DNA-binding transcriptional ArsR family regulator